MRFLPTPATPTAKLILITRGMRSVADGCISVLLPAYLLALGFDAVQSRGADHSNVVGISLADAGRRLLRSPRRRSDVVAGDQSADAGDGDWLRRRSGFWPLLLIAFVGTLNPSAGDVSVFLPLEQTALSGAIADRDRTDLFARYSLVGSLLGAGGALLAIVPDHLAGLPGADRVIVYQQAFPRYAAVGLLVGLIYRRLPADPRRSGRKPPRRSARRAASSSGSPRCSASMPSPAAGRPVAAGAVAVRGVRSVGRGDGEDLLRDQPVVGDLLPRGAHRRAHRPDQHHGVHPSAGQRLPDDRAVRR